MSSRKSSTGYFYDDPKIGPSAQTRYYYSSEKVNPDHIGGSPLHILLGQIFQGLYSFVYPLDANSLMAVIILFVLQRFQKNRMHVGGGGGSYIETAAQVLAPLGKNTLVAMAALLLMTYLIKKVKKQKGGQCGDKKDIFLTNIINILKTNHKQRGGVIMDTMYKIVEPATSVGASAISVSALLIALNKLFKGSKGSKGKYQGGAAIIPLLGNALAPLGINNFLVAVGLTSLTKYSKKLGGGKKEKKEIMDNISGCQLMGGKRYKKKDKNCGCPLSGGNALEIVGDKALNYSKNIPQFGCNIPEWGENLGKCI